MWLVVCIRVTVNLRTAALSKPLGHTPNNWLNVLISCKSDLDMEAHAVLELGRQRQLDQEPKDRLYHIESSTTKTNKPNAMTWPNCRHLGPVVAEQVTQQYVLSLWACGQPWWPLCPALL